MSARGTIRGTHHLTFCVGGAQEDYDFHVKTLGLRSIKKTVLFDGAIPVYHLYYGNGDGDVGTILTSFPYRQVGWMGKRGTNQLRRMNLAISPDSLGFWADRLKSVGFQTEETERFGAPRLEFSHPAGVEYSLVGDLASDERVPYEGGGVPGEHGIHGVYGTSANVREPEPMDFFLTEGLGAQKLASDGKHHQYEIGTEGAGRRFELVEDDGPQGTWNFGEGTIHHHAFDVVSAENQAAIKDWVVGLGFTDASDVKDRGYFHSVYCRTPSGALFEFAYSIPQGWTIDEPFDELGTHMCIPPHWEDRRAEISQLEPIETEEKMADPVASEAVPESRGGD